MTRVLVRHASLNFKLGYARRENTAVNHQRDSVNFTEGSVHINNICQAFPKICVSGPLIFGKA